MTAQKRHCGLDPQEDHIHQDFPRDDARPWKENCGFVAVDPENDAVFMFHFSLMRNKRMAKFSRWHNIQGEMVRSDELFDIDENLSEFAQGRLKVEFVEPFEKMRVTDNGDDYQLEVNLQARFDAYDWGEYRKAQGKKPTMEHYEQAMTFTATHVQDGITRKFSGYGYRDHSWGFREDVETDGWIWAWAHFPNSLVMVTEQRLMGKAYVRGYVATNEGLTRVNQYKFLEGEFDEYGKPTATRFQATDVNGRTYTLASRCFSPVHRPYPSLEESINSNGMQLFIPFCQHA